MFEFFKNLEKEAFLMPSEEKLREKVKRQVPYEVFKEKALAEGRDHSEEAYKGFVREEVAWELTLIAR